MSNKKLVYIILACVVMVFMGMIGSYLIGRGNAKYIAIDLSLEEPTFDEREPRYKFMPKEFSNYICDMCEGLGDDSDLDVSILMRENPKFDPMAIHVNENGTVATAATVIEVVCAGIPEFREQKQLTFDRPFIYAIVDGETGLPVFVGTVNALSGSASRRGL